MSVREHIKSYTRQVNRPDKLNILVVGTTHERYEQALAMTGHSFYCVSHGKQWDYDYGKKPDNYILVQEIPYHISFDLVLVHTSCERLATAIDLAKFFNLPVIRHTHTLPTSQEEVAIFRSTSVHLNTFISEYSRNKWGFNSTNSIVVEHGLDTDFWCVDSHIERNNYLLSAVNLWAQRDWACGWSLWKQTINSNKSELPYRVIGKNPGLSEPAKSIEDLRQEYQSAKIFLNTSLHSPVPMSLLEAMACGCAIVSTNTCMIPEIIKHGYNGLLASNSEELREHCCRLLSDDELAKNLGENARNTIKLKHSLQKFTQSWNTVFKEVLQ
jgi:glycosyltransferase involved in cell wall biosynthesis